MLSAAVLQYRAGVPPGFASNMSLVVFKWCVSSFSVFKQILLGTLDTGGVKGMLVFVAANTIVNGIVCLC